MSQLGRSIRSGSKIEFRKDPEREFFEMTVLAFQLSHSSHKSLMTLDRNKLYFQCKSEHPMFKDWPNWVNATLTRVMLNEKYNKERNTYKSVRESMQIQSVLNAANSDRNKSINKKRSDNVRESILVNASVVGDFETRSRPFVADNSEQFALEKADNSRVTVICNFKVEENYMSKR